MKSQKQKGLCKKKKTSPWKLFKGILLQWWATYQGTFLGAMRIRQKMGGILPNLYLLDCIPRLMQVFGTAESGNHNSANYYCSYWNTINQSESNKSCRTVNIPRSWWSDLLPTSRLVSGVPSLSYLILLHKEWSGVRCMIRCTLNMQDKLAQLHHIPLLISVVLVHLFHSVRSTKAPWGQKYFCSKCLLSLCMLLRIVVRFVPVTSSIALMLWGCTRWSPLLFHRCQ